MDAEAWDCPLQSARLKFRRADEHGKALDDEIKQFLRTTPYRLVPEISADGYEHRFRVRVRARVPDRVSLVLGDCISNYRAALDHLAFRLVELEQGSAGQDSMFPVWTTCERFRVSGYPRIRNMGSEAQAAVMRRQPCYRRPYHARHLDPLTLLNELCNVDKHRRLHLLGSAPTAFGHYGPEPHAEGVFNTGPFVDNAVVLAYTYTTPHPQIEVQPIAAFGIAFPNGPPGHGQVVLTALHRIRTEVREILDEFEVRFFGSSAQGCHDAELESFGDASVPQG